MKYLSCPFLLMVALYNVLAEEIPCSLVGSGSELHYATTAKGDRICDFSYAGYRGGGVALPDVPEKAMYLAQLHDSGIRHSKRSSKANEGRISGCFKVYPRAERAVRQAADQSHADAAALSCSDGSIVPRFRFVVPNRESRSKDQGTGDSEDGYLAGQFLRTFASPSSGQDGWVERDGDFCHHLRQALWS